MPWDDELKLAHKRPHHVFHAALKKGIAAAAQAALNGEAMMDAALSDAAFV